VTEDPTATAVLDILKRSDQALSAGDIKQALAAGGASTAEVDRTWAHAQKRLRSHEHVVVEHGHRYRWIEQTPAVTPVQALDLLADSRLPAQRRKQLVELIRSALSAETDEPAELDTATRRVVIPAMRALAELASEVEELAYNEASAHAMIQRVRGRLQRSSLEPIDGAGEQSTSDRNRHEPIGRPISDGTPVVVVRPGYVWKAASGDVLLARAVVQDRTG
jgi:hypothetical protein